MRSGETGVISAMIGGSYVMIGATSGKTDGKSVKIDAIMNGANSREIGGSYVTIGLMSDEITKTCAGTAGTIGMILVGDLGKRREIL